VYALDALGAAHASCALPLLPRIILATGAISGYMGRFTRYKEIVDKYGIQEADGWNCDKRGFRCGIMAKNWIVFGRRLILDLCCAEKKL